MSDQSTSLVPSESRSQLTALEVRAQVNLIQEIVRAVMKRDVHFGEIPGMSARDGEPPRYVLFKPGAEKLCLTFQLVPSFDIEFRDLGNGHREYEFSCTLTHRQSGTVIGQGVGTCSTMESKYRYRWDNTGRDVPKAYWDARDSALLGGPSFAARKAWENQKQVWKIFQKIEHSDPADYWNTVKKIAKKRALVDATITATAAGDIFAQDLVDEEAEPGHEPETAKQEGPKPPVTPPQAKPKNGGGGTPPQSTAPQLRVTILKVTSKNGTTNGKPWTRYGILFRDPATNTENWANTFSETLADEATSFVNKDVMARIKTTDRGIELEAVEEIKEG